MVRCRAKVRCDDGRWPNRTLQADGRQTCVGAWHCLRRQGADASVPIRRRAMVSWVECCDTRAARRGRRKGSKFGKSGFPKAGAVAGKCGKVGCLALAFACLPCASSIVDGHAFRYKAPAFWRGYRPAFLLGADQDMNDGKLRPSFSFGWHLTVFLPCIRASGKQRRLRRMSRCFVNTICDGCSAILLLLCGVKPGHVDSRLLSGSSTHQVSDIEYVNPRQRCATHQHTDSMNTKTL